MAQDRTEQAVQRIEAALARIAKVAESGRAPSAALSNLVDKHEDLRETVANSIKQLDRLIAELDR